MTWIVIGLLFLIVFRAVERMARAQELSAAILAQLYLERRR